jgi:O-antigen ligase
MLTTLERLSKSIRSRPLISAPLWILLLLFTFSLSYHIEISETLLAITVLYYLYWKLRYNRHIPKLPLFIPLLFFIATNVLSAFFSLEPDISFWRLKQMVLFIIIPLFYDVVQEPAEDIQCIHSMLFTSALISCARGLYQFFTVKGELITNRMTGFLGHWMTFSGILMMVAIVLFSYLILAKEKPGWFYVAFAIYCLTLLLSLTRNAWLGFLTASLILVSFKQPKWILAVPAAAVLIFIASIWIFPSVVSERITNTFNTQELSNRDRLEMLKSGMKIIRDYPWTGSGGGTMHSIYARYRSPASIQVDRSHLHNNFVQIAAEYGLFTLAAWLWLIGKIIIDLARLLGGVRDENKMFVQASIAVVASLLIAGLFEYNFGDSEVLMVFLVLTTLPYTFVKRPLNLRPIHSQTERAERATLGAV